MVYGAHGISPEVRRKSQHRRLVEIDATCPLVTKVHLEVLRFARDGYKIVFIGHRNHDEAVGTVGEAQEDIYIVESPEEVRRLQVPEGAKLAYVTQTTLSIQDANSVIDALKARFPDIKAPPKEDICYATTNRQSAVTQLADEADLVLVIGSKNSSNSRRLVETSEAMGVPGYLIDDESEIDPAWLVGKKSVMVTAAFRPEILAGKCSRAIAAPGEFDGVIDARTLVLEDVSFSLPKSLKSLAVLQLQ